jgi:hypothetical protein
MTVQAMESLCAAVANPWLSTHLFLNECSLDTLLKAIAQLFAFEMFSTRSLNASFGHWKESQLMR